MRAGGESQGRADLYDSICEAVRPFAHADDDVLQRNFEAEVDRQGLSALTDMEVAYLITRVRKGQRRAGWWLVGHRLHNIAHVLHEARAQLATGEIPNWAQNPKFVGDVPLSLKGVDEHVLKIRADVLNDGAEIIARFIRAVANQAEAGQEECRPVDCWLTVSLENLIEIWIGDSRLGVLGTETEYLDGIRAAVTRFGGQQKAVAADALLYGSSLFDARLEIWAPTYTYS